MNILDLFKGIKKSFTVQKKVDFDEYNLHIIMEPISALEEIKILEACTSLEGGAFMAELKRSSLAYAIKKINDIDFYDNIIEYTDVNGNPIKETKYIFLRNQLDEIPVALRDLLFEAFNNMLLELEDNVNKKARFERFSIQTVEEPKTAELGIPSGFRKIEKTEEPEEHLDEVEKLNRQVKKEAESVEMGMSNTQYEAEKING